MKYLRLLFILILSFFAVIPTSGGVAFADENVYSDVLDDLSVDKKFNSDDYPINQTDFSLQVIQIAESTDNELLIYVYQPSAGFNLMATTISLSTTINSGISPTLYYLEYLSSNGVFFKYRVKDFSVAIDNAVRYYEIYEIHRKWNSKYDVSSGNDNTIDEVAFPVGKQWSFGSVNGNSFVECHNVDYIIIEDFYVGFCRYYDGYSPLAFAEYTDCHVVAFSTDRRIDTLVSARVSFFTQSCVNEDGDIKVGSSEYKIIDLSKNDVVTSDSDRWLANKYQWNRIQTVDEFLAQETDNAVFQYENSFVSLSVTSTLKDSCIAALKNMQWVLRFYETPFVDSSNMGAGYYKVESTRISQVTILRLEFITDGVTYNLGVVANKQTGSDSPMNDSVFDIEIADSIKEFLKILAIILGVVFMLICLPFVLKAVGMICKVIIAPFRWLFGRSSARKYNGKRR